MKIQTIYHYAAKQPSMTKAQAVLVAAITLAFLIAIGYGALS